MSIKVIKGGFLSLLQDYGRFGVKQHGISQSGALDEHAFLWANHLINNDFNAACLEIAFGAVELEVKINTFISVTGADLDFKINGKPAKIWHSLQVKKSDILTFGKSKNGVRAYLAVSGGFETEVFFGSRSVNLREKIGSKLKKGDTLPCHRPKHDFSSNFINPKFIPNYHQSLVLSLVPAYQFEQFTNSEINKFFTQNWRISNAFDRSGCRLLGEPIYPKNKTSISEGISYGTVEITPDGTPIILLKDAPSIGGYTKIGTVASLNLTLLAQKQSGDTLTFQPTTINQAELKRQKFNAFFGIT